MILKLNFLKEMIINKKSNQNEVLMFLFFLNYIVLIVFFLQIILYLHLYLIFGNFNLFLYFLLLFLKYLYNI